MKTKTLTIRLNDEQLPIILAEPNTHLSFTTHANGNELELTGNRAGLLLLAKAALGMAETIHEDGFHIHLDDLYSISGSQARKAPPAGFRGIYGAGTGLGAGFLCDTDAGRRADGKRMTFRRNNYVTDRIILSSQRRPAAGTVQRRLLRSGLYGHLGLV